MDTTCFEATVVTPKQDDATDPPTEVTRLRTRAERRSSVERDAEPLPIARLLLARERHASLAPAPAGKSLIGGAITVISDDHAFADQLRTALDDSAWSIATTTMETAVEVAAANEQQIFVVDVAPSRSALEALGRQLRACNPRIALVLAGSRDQSALLIALQSSAVVDGFLLKPLTAGATRLVVEAAARRLRTSEEHAAPSSRDEQMRAKSVTRVRSEDGSPTIEAKHERSDHRTQPVAVPALPPPKQSILRPVWALLLVVSTLLAIAAWLTWRQDAQSFDVSAIAANHLALADKAAREGRWLDIRDGAALHYQTVLAIDPTNIAAQRGLERVATQLSRQAQSHMAEQELASASALLDQLRTLQPDYAELPLLEAQLKSMQAAPPITPPVTSLSASAPVTPPPAQEAPRTQPTPPATPAASDRRSNSPEKIASLTNIRRPLIDAIAPTAPVVDVQIPEPQAPSSITPEPPAATAVDKPPAPGRVLLNYVAPIYPREGLTRAAEGWIRVGMLIAPDGTVLEPRIEDGVKRQLFGRPALAAVRQWRYSPNPNATGNEPLSVRLEFRLKD